MKSPLLSALTLCTDIPENSVTPGKSYLTFSSIYKRSILKDFALFEGYIFEEKKF